MTTKRKKYKVLSPDGFTIERCVTYYPSKKKALNALETWMKRYEVQGYYSYNLMRIPLNELKNNCTIIEL
jgi:hypothetical protein